MSIDLGAILDSAEGAVQQLITTSRTTITFTRTDEGRGSGTTDPETLEWTPQEPTAIAEDVPVFLFSLGGGLGSAGTATEVQIGDVGILMLTDLVDIVEQDLGTVTACRDPRLIGREMDVVTLLESSAGIIRVVHARPRTLGPGGA